MIRNFLQDTLDFSRSCAVLKCKQIQVSDAGKQEASAGSTEDT